jgi:putative DNA primase/helicase
MPLFRDASAAIVSRYLILKATRTIPVAERIHELGRQIIAEELPGIFRLALEGLFRLRARGFFKQPASAMDLLNDAEEIASPIKVFAAEYLNLSDPEATIPTSDLYSLWATWARAHGYPASNDAAVGKNLKAAFPSVMRVRPGGGERPRSYKGVGLNADGWEKLRPNSPGHERYWRDAFWYGVEWDFSGI